MENKVHSYLKEWIINFIKNKDLVHRKIEHIENGKDGFDIYVKYKDREQFVVVEPSMNNIDVILKRFDQNSHCTIATLNSKANFDAVIKSWDKLTSYKFLNIIFANPFSQIDQKWIVFPHTHHMICDESSLKNGLKSMFETVEPIEEGQLVAKITS